MQLTKEQKQDLCNKILSILTEAGLPAVQMAFDDRVNKGALANSFSLVEIVNFVKDLLAVFEEAGSKTKRAVTHIDNLAAVFIEQDKDRKHREQMNLQQQILRELRHIRSRLDVVERKINSQPDNEPAKTTPQLFKY